MPHAASVSEKHLNEIAGQVSGLIHYVVDHEQLFNKSIELRETFEVWMLGFDTIGYGAAHNVYLKVLARNLGRYHHQIMFGGIAEAFARSSVSTTDPGLPTLEELFVSPLAQKIDQAIEWVDQWVSGDPLVHLLFIPAYYLHAFWLIDANESSELLIVDVAGASPTDYETILSGLQAEKLYTDSIFLQALAKTAPAMGVYPGGAQHGRP